MATTSLGSFGRYQLLELLGRGGMGEVFRAYNTVTDRVVAIKLLPAHLADDPEFQRRFRREAHTAAGLNDPHVVPIHNYGEIDGQLYVDMRLIEGGDLGSVIADDGGRLTPARAVAIIEQVAAALDAAHEVGLVHRDVKPSNILLTARNFVYLIDFGIARAANQTALTSTGHTVGTLAYMAPERFSGTIDPRSDVYSLACVLHECLTGHRPYPGDSLEQQLAGHLNTPPPRPSIRFPDIPPAFDAVIARGMAKNLDERYRTATELAEAARAALTRPMKTTRRSLPPQTRTQPASAHPAKPATNTAAVPTMKRDVRRPSGKLERQLERRDQQARRRRILSIAAGSAGAVAVVAAVATTVWYTNHEHHKTQGSAAAGNSAGATPTPSGLPGAPPLPSFTPSAGVGTDCQYPASPEPASKQANPPRTGKVPTDPAQVSVSMVTDRGNVGLMLANNESPCTVNSFVSLAQQKFFDNTQCHRLTTSPTLGVLQCGDPTGNGAGGPGYQFANEYPTDQYQPDEPKMHEAVVYPHGTLAMANAGPNTNGSQFFMVYNDSLLPPEYTVFGTIQEDGLATLDKIAKDGVRGGGEDGPPATAVTITSVRMD
ncbi:protein kinase domain-containing protein [Mycobacterium sp.]|uniref:protein kinase domain-containing protein n=1 Tax=Mycobacterium sp. TaxID=1785 RepID=UPI003D6C1224